MRVYSRVDLGGVPRDLTGGLIQERVISVSDGPAHGRRGGIGSTTSVPVSVNHWGLQAPLGEGPVGIPRPLIPVSGVGRRVWSGLGHGRRDANRNGTTTVLMSASMFGAIALYGSTMKRGLAGVGQFLCMGLIGLVLASLLGLFWHNNALQFLSLLRLFGTRRE